MKDQKIMSIERDKFPVVLTIIENLGLSSSWTGNAVASANPVNFYSLWKRNPHSYLYPNKTHHTAVFENEEIDLARLFSGKDVKSDKEYFLDITQRGKLKESEILGKNFKECAERNAALHLVGNFPTDSSRFSDKDQLLSIINFAKEQNIYRIYIHFIVDESLMGRQEEINSLVLKIAETKSAEIASVAGQNFLDDGTKQEKNFLKGLHAIVSGQGDPALSSEQALNFSSEAKIADKKPTSILFKNRYVAKLNNFDTILFFNHNNKSLTKLILAVSTGNISGRIRIPKMLSCASIFNPLDQEIDGLKTLYNRESENTLAQIIYSSHIDQLYLSDSSRISTTNRYLKGKITGQGGAIKELFAPVLKNINPINYNQALSMILRQLEYSLEKKEFRFITVLIPALSEHIFSNFPQYTAVIKMLDKFLPLIEKTVLKHNGALVVTSNHGGCEKLSDRDPFELTNSKTQNPVPFILTIPGYAGSGEKNNAIVGSRMFYDMIKKRHFISDFAPTILQLLGIEKPEEMIGRSFLSDLQIVKI